MRNSTIDDKTAPYGALLLRVSLGLMFIAHSLYLKVVVFTVPGTVQFFESLGLPGFSAYLVIAAIFAEPLFRLLGGQGPELAGAVYDRFGDEHGKIVLGEGNAAPELGAPISLITPHCDPTVNLHDYLHCVRGDKLVDIWPIDARGVL